MGLPLPAIVLVLIALLFSFLNGAKDGANSLATVITSRAMSMRSALWMVGLAEFAGPFVFGIAVAQTIGAGVVDPAAVTVLVVIATLASANIWNVLTWRLGIPTSSSHALIGGLVGAVMAANDYDFRLLQSAGLIKVGVGLFLAPVIGLTAAYAVTQIARFVLRPATPRVNWFFKRGQLLTTLGLALSHGANDAPKSMGMITMGLVASGVLSEFRVPTWVIVAAASAVALGTMLGSRRLVRTIGTRFYRVRALEAFSSQVASGLVVIAASLSGSPVSTSQVVSSAIVGAGAADRLTRVRWGVMQEIVVGWLLTIPATGVASAAAYWLLAQWFPPQ